MGDSKAPGSVAAAAAEAAAAAAAAAVAAAAVTAAESYLHLSSRGRGSHTNAPNKPAPIRKEIMMA